MNKFVLKTGFSLIELIVATVLVAIVVLGLFAVNSVLNNNNQDYGQRYLVKSETQDALNHILNNASLAVGSGTTDSCNNLDQGIIIGTAGLGNGDMVNNPNSFCIHQGANNNIINSNNDIWLCYTWYLAANQSLNNSANSIYYCTMLFTDTAPACPAFRGAASCNGIANSQYLGTALTNPVTTFSPTAASQMVFTATIQNCLDNSQSTNACNTPNNPEVTTTGSAYPPQEGQQQN